MTVETLVLNGWAASPRAWDLCRFPRKRIFSYTEQLDGLPELELGRIPEPVLLVGWSMGGSTALRLACRYPRRIAGLVLVAATPRMMEDRGTDWKGMSPLRLEALRRGLEMTKGEGFFGPQEGRPNPYAMDTPANLERGLKYLLETDLRGDLERVFGGGREPFPVRIFQSERDGIVRAANARYLKSVFPAAAVRMVPGTEHALPVTVPEEIDAACLSCSAAGLRPPAA